MRLVIVLMFFFGLTSIANGQCYTSGQSLPSTGFVVNTSGYSDLDSIVRNEINNLQVFFGVKIDFFFLIETYNKNAMYIPICNYNCNGTVFLGIKMLYTQLKKEHGIECVKAVLAHEFGHCVQHIMNWKEFGKRPELHSDFMAGYYTGQMYNYSEEQMNSLFNEFYSIGDNNYWSIEHHGSKYERKCAFEEGYYFAKENYTSVTTANSYAIQYVVANNPCGVRKYKAVVAAYQNEVQKRKAKLENDILMSNVGSIKFKAIDDKKYKVVTVDGYGQEVIYPINQTYLGINEQGQQIVCAAIKEVKIDPISANTVIPFRIFRYNWFFGYIPIIQFSSKICPNSTVVISFQKGSYSIDNICP